MDAELARLHAALRSHWHLLPESVLAELAAGPPGPTWSEAQVQLAWWAMVYQRNEELVARTGAVLAAADAATPRALALAGVYPCLVAFHAERAVDLALLERSAVACIDVGEDVHAGTAHVILAKCRRREGDREGARRALGTAIELFDHPAKYGVRVPLLLLAEWLAEDGDVEGARAALDRALTSLSRFRERHGAEALTAKLYAARAQLDAR